MWFIFEDCHYWPAEEGRLYESFKFLGYGFQRLQLFILSLKKVITMQIKFLLSNAMYIPVIYFYKLLII